MVVRGNAGIECRTNGLDRTLVVVALGALLAGSAAARTILVRSVFVNVAESGDPPLQTSARLTFKPVARTEIDENAVEPLSRDLDVPGEKTVDLPTAPYGALRSMREKISGAQRP